MRTDPGGGYGYSTQGVHVASMELRRTAGMEMEDFIRRQIAAPLQFEVWGYATVVAAIRD